jgi:putative mycofactocin binding protein MftB
MELQKDKKYILAPGTQVREEAFGLLFYTMAGPRLYFMSSGDLINSDFFQGALTLDQWIGQRFGQNSVTRVQISELRTSLNRLKEKGVILEC